MTMTAEPNPHGRPNSDVLVPWANGKDITSRPRGMWIIDYGVGMEQARAAAYERPFSLVETHVKPLRDTNRRDSYRLLWWQHVEPRPALRETMAPLGRFIATPRVSKHRLFAWMTAPTLPDCQLIVFARSDDYFFGVLHSRFHEVWALKLGTRLETRPRYTPTSCFETFPFPWPPGEEPAGDERVTAIAAAAAELDGLRERWLNPPEWTREEVLEFPGTVGGPWTRYIVPNAGGTPALPAGSVGMVRYPRLVPRDADCAARLKNRTLTKLYNERPAWLADVHARLDAAVAAAYGWPADLPDEAILERLLELNRQRSVERGDAQEV
jgi:hypothetical protein